MRTLKITADPIPAATDDISCSPHALHAGAPADPDRRFLSWILTGLIIATIGSGFAALAMALTTANI